MAEKKETNVIELRKVFRTVMARRRTFYKTLSLVFILSCVYIFSQPRTYSTDTSVAPEMSSPLSGGTLGSIASSFGFDLGDMETSDAITPLLYPDLMDDNKFVTAFFNMKVTTQDGELTTTYFDYLYAHQKAPWWNFITNAISSLFKSEEKDGSTGSDSIPDPYRLNRTQDEVARTIRGNIKMSVDKKSGVVSINVKDQDPLICKTIADSVRQRLQVFITDYRTNKARIDVDYYQQLSDNAKEEYEQARIEYSRFADSNQNPVLQTYRSKIEALENEMQLKYNAYTVINTQLQQAISKVQERTPAFTTLKGAEVPIKPSGPKRMIFVAGMLFLTFVGTTLWVARKELHFTF